MFPKYSDFNIQYTTKGLVKLRIKQTLQLLTLIAFMLGLFYIRKDVRGGLKGVEGWVRGGVKFVLLRLVGWIESGVRMLDG